MVFLNNILGFVIQIGAIVVVLMLVYVGFIFVTARGEPAKLTTARQAFLWTLIGALILIGAQAISIGICQTTNALSTGGNVTSCVF
jgi:heme/copper-type cytochrome/quinol oxidase subunit 2